MDAPNSKFASRIVVTNHTKTNMWTSFRENEPLTPALSPSDGEREGFLGGAFSQGGAALALGYSSLAPMGLQFEPTRRLRKEL